MFHETMRRCLLLKFYPFDMGFIFINLSSSAAAIMPPPKPLLFASSSTNYHYQINFVGFLVILMLLLLPTLADADCNHDDKHSLLSFAAYFPNLNWSATVDCCSWDGISCDDKGYRVVGLSIPGRGLHGAIPSSLLNLTSLSFLNLSYNFLSGPLPNRLLSSFNNLHTIDLSYNTLSGYLPDILPSTLQLLNFSSNLFSGTIQKDILQSLQSLIVLNVGLIGCLQFTGHTPHTHIHTHIREWCVFGVGPEPTLNISNNSFAGSVPPSICTTSPGLVIPDFSLNDLTGSIPHGFGASSNLQVLSLGFNNFTGQIPTDINGARSLQHLSLPGNSLTNEIDENITSLPNLRSLVLFGNMLSGSIPHSIGKLSLLEKLELHINRLHGTLPLSLMNCTKLKLLNLRVNSLGGRLSDFDFSSLNQLTMLDLGENQFSGVLPKSLFSCKSLTAIRLATNKLEGDILPDILELPSLSFLSLSNNTFKNISQALNILSSLEKLTTLILSKNFFNETLPAAGISGFQDLRSWDLVVACCFSFELTRLPALASQHVLDHVSSSYLELPVFVAPQKASYLQFNQLANLPPALYLASNNLSGEIPVEIGNMKSIHILDLSQNYFSGTIPSSISDLTNLEMLDISRNLLSGEIPSSLASLNFLSSFSVAYNNLQCPVPTGGQFYTFPYQSYQGNPWLCGPPTLNFCIKQSHHPPSPSRHEKDLNMEVIFGPILGFCFGFGFGIILTCQTFCIVSKRRIFPRVIHRYFVWT
ncbi:putative leucine-rich repeat-containing, plant-type, leucine-rich repeat domain superfamily [Helianthus annuus]|nr:putative leucine-rich repeat-containing, plant-type, leucine-rich repeat domain superfamily [Helianthus annuus]